MGAENKVEQALEKLTRLMDDKIKPFKDEQEKLRQEIEALRHPRFRAAGTDVLAGLERGQFVDQSGKVYHFSDFLKAIRNKDEAALREFPVNESRVKTLSGDGGAPGGFLVPDVFLAELMRAQSENSIVAPRARSVPMSSRSILMPGLSVQGTTAGETRFFGGVKAQWTEENAAKPETEPTFRQIELTVREIAGHTIVSNQLLADSSISVDSLLLSLFGEATAWYEDFAYLRGDGVGKPLGVFNSPCTIGVTRATTSEVNLADVATMLSRLLPSSAGSAVWVINPTVLPQLLTMSLNNNPVFIANAREGAPQTLFGLPVIISEKVPTLGTKGDIGLFDFRQYLIGDRQDMSIDLSRDFKFTSGQTTFRFMHRVDGQPMLDSAITLADGSTTVSPFVLLNA